MDADPPAQGVKIARRITTKGHVSGMWSDTEDTLDQAAHTAGAIASSPAARDQLLLGAAGLAVVAALGIACQRRFTEQTEAN